MTKNKTSNKKTQGSDLDEMRLTDVDLAHQQAVKYGLDMARVYREERAKREALEVAYKKLEGALDSMSDGFMVVGKELTITEINRSCADLFELAPEEAVGKLLPRLLISDEADTFCNMLLGVERRKLTYPLDLLLPIQHSLVIHAAPLPDGGWVLVVRNVTWEKRVNNMREEFLNLAAHELRTPLAGIIGFTSLFEQMVEREDLSNDIWALVNNIMKSAERLRSTITDLLDFTAGDNLTIDAKLIDLREVVEDGIILLGRKAAERGVSIRFKPPEMPLDVFGDRKMLATAVGHLIENAIQYNKPQGSVTIDSRTTEDSFDLTFTDTGVGIARKDLEYIFKPFFQVEEHTTRSTVGMGLGISIAQRIITLHQGTLKAESELNSGSVFTITMPRYDTNNLEATKSEWLKIERNLRTRAKKPGIDEQTQNLINQLKTQLEMTQSQNVAYAKDLAILYQMQRAEAQAVEAERAKTSHNDRLALMGQLAAGVAHDLSNLISPILGYSQVILRKRDVLDPSMVEIIERILKTSRRANTLLRQMVTLSRNQAESFELIDINPFIDDIMFILEIRLSHAQIEIKKDYTESLPPIYGSQVQLSQVMLNTLVNAMDAMPQGGTLTIKTARAVRQDNEFIEIQISDTGIGIDPKDLPRIFEAFFTTKSAEAGTGLGLSVSKDIIDNHRGQILVDSVLHRGSTFTIFLPVAEADIE